MKKTQGKVYILLGLFATLYILAISYLSILRYDSFNCGVDLYHMDTTMWNFWKEGILQGTYVGKEALSHRFAYHVEPIYYAVSLLYGIWDDPRILLLFQTLIVGMGVFPVFRLAKEKLRSDFGGLAIACTYLLFPVVSSANLFDFHGDTLSMTPLLFSLYFLSRKKYAPFLISILIALMCKEYIGLIAFVLGIYLLWTRENTKIGLFTGLTGLAWFFIATQIITPYFNQGRETATLAMNYSRLGNGGEIVGILKTVLTKPGETLAIAFNSHNLKEIIKLILPTGGLVFLGLPEIFISIPILAKDLLTGELNIGNHRLASAVPFIMMSSIHGLHRLNSLVQTGQAKIKGIQRLRFGTPNYIFLGSAYLLFFIFLNALFFTGTPFLSLKFWDKNDYFYWKHVHRFRVTEHDHIADRMLARIPPEARVMATGGLMAKLGHRRESYRFPRIPAKGLSEIDYIIVDTLEDSFPEWNSRKTVLKGLKDILNDSRFGLIDFRDGLLLFKKGAPDEVPRQSYRVLTNLPGIEKRIDQSHGGISLIGYTEYRNRSGGMINYYWKKIGPMEGHHLLVDLYKSQEERVVHLPSFVLSPMKDWPIGALFEETIAYQNGKSSPHEILFIKVPTAAEIVTDEEETNDHRLIARIKIS